MSDAPVQTTNLLSDIADLLERRAGDSVPERRALLREAFFGTNAPLARIPDETKPRVFAVACLSELFDFGRLADGRHGVSVLLQTMHQRCLGAEDQRLAEALVRRVEEASPGPRTRELRHLEGLLERRELYLALYTPLAGEARRVGGAQRRTVRATVMRPEYERRRVERLTAQGHDEEPAPTGEVTRSEDIRSLVADGRPAVLLGEPGAGKTTSLWELVQERAEAAMAAPAHPMPVLVALGTWLAADERLEAFIARHMGLGSEGLGQDLEDLLKSRRISLFLDGLNEMPVDQRADKAQQIKAFLRRHHGLQMLVSCRDLDYNSDEALNLGIDRIHIQPLSPTRILDFITRHLTDVLSDDEPDRQRRAERGRQDAEHFFWELAGGEDVRECWLEVFRRGIEISLDHFWSASSWDGAIKFSGGLWRSSVWWDKVGTPSNLTRLAANPYMLHMLVDTYVRQQTVPANRGELFDDFIAQLMEREGLAPDDERAGQLCAALGALALAMQRGDAEDDAEDTTMTAYPRELAIAEGLCTADQQRLAAGASVLTVDNELRFTHQLLQEYFAARGMREGMVAGTLDPRSLWPRDHWWVTTGWEETTVLLAGLFSDDCSPVILWVQEANPLLAARCILNSGAKVPRDTLLALRAAWLPRMTDSEQEPNPLSRAAIGRALAMLTVEEDGKQVMLDNRPGVGVYRDTIRNRLMPDIDWVTIPGGTFTYKKGEQGEREVTLSPFKMARYPVTWAQFQAFVSDPDGYSHATWWEGLQKRSDQPDAARWPLPNTPRETVDWDEAMAFGRWLTAQLRAAGQLAASEEARLPSEQEWERAACGTDGREYPWGDGCQPGQANINEADYLDRVGPYCLGQTSAVGMYGNGATPPPENIHDQAGNVWEWCLDRHERDLFGNAARVVRGGSWSSGHHYARAAYRSMSLPDFRFSDLGFRLAVSSPVPFEQG